MVSLDGVLIASPTLYLLCHRTTYMARMMETWERRMSLLSVVTRWRWAGACAVCSASRRSQRGSAAVPCQQYINAAETQGHDHLRRQGNRPHRHWCCVPVDLANSWARVHEWWNSIPVDLMNLWSRAVNSSWVHATWVHRSWFKVGGA